MSNYRITRYAARFIAGIVVALSIALIHLTVV
jgi:hypothetical protein